MGRLTAEQLKFYKDNGYIVLKKLIKGKELERLSEEYDNLFRRKNEAKTESSWVGSDESHRESDSPYTVKGIHNLQYHHAVFGRYLYNDDLLDAVEDIIGTPNIALHHTKAHYKPPEKGASYPMHQDYPYFPYEKDSMTAVVLFLDDADVENGTLFVWPGSHKLGPLEDFGPKEGSNFHYVDQKKFPIERATPVLLEAGDVVVFSYLTLHGSSPNVSRRPRRMFLAQLYDAHDRPAGGERGQPGRGWLLRGVNEDRDATVANRALD
ncbi:phytanoyl-CoA dioxygenase, peroxisomal-like [Leptidea sinapis]|uniref:phytanoyl-CoA dioxygenase n=1 Tax=Leptidea sinapis TaxID=189913 RepID=A0A5E4PKP8_9NEOP|nr:phytanoyl-CoA dioxygenase, peroxisomal-like [Leptidea sinapis]VVC86490.1 unnamed protein product [Leptidea sinapis]